MSNLTGSALSASRPVLRGVQRDDDREVHPGCAVLKGRARFNRLRRKAGFRLRRSHVMSSATFYPQQPLRAGRRPPLTAFVLAGRFFMTAGTGVTALLVRKVVLSRSVWKLMCSYFFGEIRRREQICGCRLAS